MSTATGNPSKHSIGITINAMERYFPPQTVVSFGVTYTIQNLVLWRPRPDSNSEWNIRSIAVAKEKEGRGYSVKKSPIKMLETLFTLIRWTQDFHAKRPETFNAPQYIGGNLNPRVGNLERFINARSRGMEISFSILFREDGLLIVELINAENNAATQFLCGTEDEFTDVIMEIVRQLKRHPIA